MPRHLTSLGLEAVREATPGTVWVSVRGAGGDGPAGALPGYDAMAQARAGLMGITGHPETGPVKVGVAITDVVTGLYAAVAALAGLLRRGGEGHRAPRLEVGLLEAAVSTLVNQAANHLVGGIVPGPAGNEHPNIAPYGPVRCADRDLVVGAGNDRQFAALCRAVGLARLCDDGRFASNAGRVEHRDALAAELAAVFTERTADAWRTVLEDAGVPCAPVNAVDEVFADPHVRAVDLVSTVEHPLGTLPLVGSPLRVDSRRLQVRRPPPTLGQHTGEILRTLGFDDTRIAAMRARGAC